MAQIISLHSFHRGTGKSTTIANLAALMALKGKRVGVIDAGFQSPSAHILFDLPEEMLDKTLNDYALARCEIIEATYDVTAKIGSDVKGKVYLVPSSPSTLEIMELMRKGYEISRLNKGLADLTKAFDLDTIFLDTHAGLTEETFMGIAICDVMLMIVRIDHQDHQGTAVILDLARKLGVSDIRLLLNEVPPNYDLENLGEEMAKMFKSELTAIIPHSTNLLELASQEIFVLKYPEHPLTDIFKSLAASLD